ncbi:hypothetical protein Nepgr_011534 [Nepenthes gracilis]|uniref:Uncharacterized protein n=1 Tax=Nepenthes gracilis TaxID=150966 RepID=A0AAD3SED1_NEPGR|nr:hypothetical protein Nepgr_011534 [Nepenthes gracilis]
MQHGHGRIDHSSRTLPFLIFEGEVGIIADRQACVLMPILSPFFALSMTCCYRLAHRILGFSVKPLGVVFNARYNPIFASVNGGSLADAKLQHFVEQQLCYVMEATSFVDLDPGWDSASCFAESAGGKLAMPCWWHAAVHLILLLLLLHLLLNSARDCCFGGFSWLLGCSDAMFGLVIAGCRGYVAVA